MIPVRMGSQRLKKKNLRELNGVPLITRAIRKCIAAGVFDEIWVNSEHPAFGEIAAREEAKFHLRPKYLGDNQSTSEQYIAEFLKKHECDYLFQVHSIAPLLTIKEIQEFVDKLVNSDKDVLLAYEPVQIECAINNKPINFNFNEKTNSQDLKPVQRISWSITGWKRASYLEAVKKGKCATYYGEVGFSPISKLAANVIKTEQDLKIAEALFPLLFNNN